MVHNKDSIDFPGEFIRKDCVNTLTSQIEIYIVSCRIRLWF